MTMESDQAGTAVVLFRCTVPNNSREVDRWWRETAGQAACTNATSTESSGKRVVLCVPKEQFPLLERRVLAGETPQNTHLVVLPPVSEGGMDRTVHGSSYEEMERKQRNGGGCATPLNALPSQIDRSNYPGAS